MTTTNINNKHRAGEREKELEQLAAAGDEWARDRLRQNASKRQRAATIREAADAGDEDAQRRLEIRRQQKSAHGLAYRAENRDSIREKDAAYRANNRDHVRALKAAQRERTRARLIESHARIVEESGISSHQTKCHPKASAAEQGTRILTGTKQAASKKAVGSSRGFADQAHTSECPSEDDDDEECKPVWFLSKGPRC